MFQLFTSLIFVEGHETLEFISAGLKSVYENSLPKPDDLNNWRPGQICIAFWRFDKKWYRARVKKVILSFWEN